MTSEKKGSPATPPIKPSKDWQQAAIEEFEGIIRNAGVPARESLWESIKQKHAPKPLEPVKTQVTAIGKTSSAFKNKGTANRFGVNDEEFRPWLRQFFDNAKKLPPPRMTQGAMSLALGRAFSYIGVYLVSPERSLTRNDLEKIGELTGQDLARYLLPAMPSKKDPGTRSR